MARKQTEKLLTMIEEGVLNAEDVVTMCVKYMSEDDVADMMDSNELSDRFTEGWEENPWGEDTDYDDSMDGDHDSAMASAGMGTDEDYGYYGEEA